MVHYFYATEKSLFNNSKNAVKAQTTVEMQTDYSKLAATPALDSQ